MTDRQLRRYLEYQVQLDESSFRVPYEQMRKAGKAVNKTLEKELNQLNAPKPLAKLETKATKVSTSFAHGNGNTECQQEVLDNIDGLIQKAENLRKKLVQESKQYKEGLHKTRLRLDRVKEANKAVLKASKSVIEDKKRPRDSGDEFFNDTFIEHNTTRLNKLIIEYILRNGSGYDENSAAELMVRNLGMEQFVDLELLSECKKLEREVRIHRRLKGCLKWCESNRSSLKRMKSELEFNLNLQKFVDKVRANCRIEAVEDFQTHLAKSFEVHIEELRTALGLLVVYPIIGESEDTNGAIMSEPEKYMSLLSDDRWDKLADEFVQTFYKLHGFPTTSPLLNVLSAGISALKTKQCDHFISALISTEEEEGNEARGSKNQPQWPRSRVSRSLSSREGNSVIEDAEEDNRAYFEAVSTACPICSPELAEISVRMPYAHHLTTRISYQDPVMLPSGDIYSKEKLLKYSEGFGAKPNYVIDPKTHVEVPVSKLVTVFPT